MSAAHVWGLARHDEESAVHLTVPIPRDRTTAPRFVIHRTRQLPEDHVVVRDGLRVTSVARTLLDVAGMRGYPRVGAAVGAAIRAELTTSSELLEAVDTWGNGRRGARRLRFEAIRRSGSADHESELEDRFWAVIRKFGLQLPTSQFEVAAGGRRYRLDFAWPQERVAVECDGLGFHGAEKFRSDRERRATLTAAGWRVIEATWWDVVDRPQWVVEQVAATLELPAA